MLERQTVVARAKLRKYDLDAVRHGNISWSCKDGELTTRASPVEPFATDSAIVDESYNINIIIGSLTSLVVGTKTAAVGLAVFVDGEGIVAAGGDCNSMNA